MDEESQDLIIKSPCGLYQYVEIYPLENGTKGACAIIGLSPHTRVAGRSDKTLENCIAFAERNQFSSIVFVNIYAQLDLSPEEVVKQEEPIGLENNFWLKKAAEDCEMVVAAWGDFAYTKNRVYSVLKLLDAFDLYAIQTNRNGTPSHPLAWKKKAAKFYRRGRVQEKVAS